MAIADHIDTVINRVYPHTPYLTATTSAGTVAVAHVTLRTIRAARRMALRPLRIAVRLIRGLLVYAFIIGSVWALLHFVG